MNGLNAIWNWLPDDAALERLHDLLSNDHSLGEHSLKKELASICHSHQAASLLDFLTDWLFLTKTGTRYQSRPEFWNAYRPRIVGRDMLRKETLFQPLVNLPPELLAGRTSSPLTYHFHSFAAIQKGHVYLVNPFLDYAGREEVADLIRTLRQNGVRVTLVVRIQSQAKDNKELDKVLAKFEADDGIDGINFHYYDEHNGRIRLSFHAKGIYAPESCILATMNFIKGNMRKNVEFGVMVRGQQANQYYAALELMARHTPAVPLPVLRDSMARKKNE